MPSSDPLSRLLDVLQPSLVMYLSDSGIWTYPGDEDIKLALADLVGDQRSMVERAGVLIEERGGAVAAPAYPITFTGCHDVDMGSLLPRVIESLRRQVAQIDAIAAAGGVDEAAHDLAREARVASQRHLDVLEQVAAAVRQRRQQKSPAAPAPAAP